MVFILKTSKSWMKTPEPPPAKISSLKPDHNQSCPHGQLLSQASPREQDIPTGPVFIKEVGGFLVSKVGWPQTMLEELRPKSTLARSGEESQTHGSEGTQAAEGCRTSLHPLPRWGPVGPAPRPAASVWHSATHSSSQQRTQIKPATAHPPQNHVEK